jgi:hypothetical protein
VGHEHKWDLVDAVSRSPLLGAPQIHSQIDLADVERRVFTAGDLSMAERERLIKAARELADVYDRLELARESSPTSLVS